MAGRRRHLRRRKSWEIGAATISIRVGSRRSPRRFYEVNVSGARDAPRFARMVDDQVRAYPRDPLIICINGYQPWLQDVLGSCMTGDWESIAELAREVQFAETMQFPERASKRGQDVPWTFIVDHMNVPQVYYWSVDMEPPGVDDYGLPPIDKYRFRVGAWECGRGACRLDPDVPVALIVTRPTDLSEHVVTELMYGFLYRDNDFDQPREDEEGICWLFSRLYWLLTDWQNITNVVAIRLEEAEENSYNRHLPVKMRTRLLHREVDRLYDLKEYMRFHTRCLKKLQKLKDDVPKQEQKDPLWSDMDDAVEDLEQFESTLDSLKERFTNLIELEFNIQNVVQSDQGSFLTTIATLFLPISYLASVFGITTITWRPILYLYAVIPILVVSIIFTFTFPWTVRRIQKIWYPPERFRIPLQPRNFTMLGQELPASADLPGGGRQSGSKHRSQRMSGNGGTRSRSRSRRNEKDDDDP